MHQGMNNKKRYVGNILKALILAMLLNVFSITAYATDEFIWQARAIIENFYINEVPNEVLNKPTIKDIVDALNDPYSDYFTPQEYSELVNNINMSVTGIGVTIETVPEGVKIISILDESPAMEAGLKVGDIITMAGGKSLAGLPLDEASSYIKGEEGTKVLLQIKREDKYFTYDVTRKQISFPTVVGEMLGNTAYIKISSFGEKTSSDFRVKYEELKKHSPANYIVDIRNNGGGYLDTVIHLAGSFIGPQPVVLTKDRFNGETKILASGDVDVIDKPVILLVNEYSASASEILSAALKDYDKAFIIGTNTYGKGTVQTLFQLFDDSVLKLTVQEFFSPYGNKINKIGIKPHFEVNGVDPLTVAELLFGSSGTVKDKRGYIKIRIDNKEFEIDIKKAKEPQYLPAFMYIINKSWLSGNIISVGTVDGYVMFNGYSANKIFNTLYAGYREMAELRNVPEDKQFTVSFTQDINMDTVNDKTIELINSYSGERTGIEFETIDGRTIKVKPKEKLKVGYDYYLIINDSIKGKNGVSLQQGTVTKVHVAP